jgi:hypothetical protein
MTKQHLLPIICLLIPIVIFFAPVFFNHKLPLPADTIPGLYHPMRDALASIYPNGPAYKNFLITDPVRQQFPWRRFAVEELKQGRIPWWNPYNFSGTPLIANFQSAVFYPLNIIFWLLNFVSAWNLLIILQSVLGGIFLYYYLKHLKLDNFSALFGAFTWIFSGFFIAWLEWNTAAHVALWTPLILLSIDKLATKKIWAIVLVFSLLAQFLAGYPQPWIYLILLELAYAAKTLIGHTKLRLNFSLKFGLVLLAFILIASVQLLPTIKFSNLSNRQFDQGAWSTKPDWFLPLPNLVQIIVPDFFGNPATLNYWGVFNYTEFVSYIGIVSAAFVLLNIFSLSKKDASKFFVAFAVIGLLLATKNFISVWQFKLPIPFLSSSQPSRWIVVVDFCLSILAAFGFNQFQKNKKLIIKPLIVLSLIMGGLWLIVLKPTLFGLNSLSNDLMVSKRNLYLPSLELIGIIILAIVGFIFSKITTLSFPRRRESMMWKFLRVMDSRLRGNDKTIIVLIIILSLFSNLRFAQKFTPFSDPQFLYPPTSILTYLQQHAGLYRYMTTDRRIMAPNFNLAYHLYTIEGYDPLYLKDYGQLVYASEQKTFPNSSKPFNRIVATDNYVSTIVDLLGVKYILSIDSLTNVKLKLLMEEGQTKLYENLAVLPRAFFTDSEDPYHQSKVIPAKIILYTPSQVVVETDQQQDGKLILSDAWYPNWQVTIDGTRSNLLNWYGLRATIVPKGHHEVRFNYRYSNL